MSLSSWLLLLTLCQAKDVPTTLSREPLRIASHDTGCILERMKVQYTCELKELSSQEFTPQLMVFRIDCQDASLERKFKLWDAQHLCGHLTYAYEQSDHLRGEDSEGSQVDSFILEKGDVVQFRCILLPLNLSESSSHSVFRGTMNVAFVEEKETVAEEHITAFELVLPDDECRAAVANVYEWLLTVYKSEENRHTLIWQSPKLSLTSALGGIPTDTVAGFHQEGLLWRVGEDFLNPQVVSVTCKTLPDINRERVHVLRSNLSVVDFRDADNSTWFGVHFDIDVNVTSLPEDTQELQVVVNFSLHRAGDFIPSSHEQTVSVPVEMAHADTAKRTHSFWFRFIIFVVLALLVVAVALRLYAWSPLPQARPQARPQREIELRTTS